MNPALVTLRALLLACLLSAPALALEPVMMDKATVEQAKKNWTDAHNKGLLLRRENENLEREFIEVTALRKQKLELEQQLAPLTNILAFVSTRIVRSWTSKTGNQTVALLVYDDGFTCSFKTMDGKEVKIRRQFLIPADVDYLDVLRRATHGGKAVGMDYQPSIRDP